MSQNNHLWILMDLDMAPYKLMDQRLGGGVRKQSKETI